MSEPGGLLEPAMEAVKSQSTLDTGPIRVSDERRAQLAGTPATSGTPAEQPVGDTEPVSTPEPAQTGESPLEAAQTTELTSDSTGAPEVAAASEPNPEPAAAPEPELAPDPESVPEPDPAAKLEPPTDSIPVTEVGAKSTPESESSDASARTSEAATEPKRAATPTSPPSGDLDGEQDVAAAVLPGPPSSDQDALEALNRLPRNAPPAAGKPIFDDSESTSRCSPGDEPSRTPLTQLVMRRWGSESGKPYAILSTPKGLDFRVDIGDRLGPHGGLVVEIDTAKVTVFELRLDAEERAQTVREVIKKRP